MAKTVRATKTKQNNKVKVLTESELAPMSDGKAMIQVMMHDNELTVSSLQVAKVFGKDHDKVLRDIKELECSKEFSTANFGESNYLNSRGKEYTHFDIKFDGLMFLILGYTGKKAAEYKEAYINQFNEMRDHIKAVEKKTLEDTQKKLADANAAYKKADKNLGDMLAINEKLQERIDMPKPLEQHLADSLEKVSDVLEGVKLQVVQINHKDSMLMPIQRINTYKAMMSSLRMAISNIQMVHHIEGLKTSPGFKEDEQSMEVLNYIVHSMNKG